MPDVLLIGDSIRSPELRHEVQVEIGDPFLYAEVDGRRVAIAWSVEGDRIAFVNPTIEIVPSETFSIADLVRDEVDLYDMAAFQAVRMVRSLGITSALVPSSFPLRVADELRSAGIEIVVDQRHFDDRRRVKSAVELEGIQVAQRAAEDGMAAIVSALRRSETSMGGRVLDGEVLTCKGLQLLATEAFALRGCRGDDLTVVCGAETAGGHDPGSGRVGNDDVVLCDIFPRHLASGCFADMTRTFRLGTPDETLSLWHAQCVEALELAVSMVRPGIEGSEMHRAVSAFFEDRGHPTQLSAPEGFVLRDGFSHGLGHGVGLELHEAPGLGRLGHALVAGDVIALEPGLYRHGWGGVRIEDIVLVTDSGAEILSRFPYDLEV